MITQTFKKTFNRNYPLFYKFLAVSKGKIYQMLRIKDILLMTCSLLFFPKYFYLFTTRKFFAPIETRYAPNEDNINPFEIYNKKTSKLNRIREANLIVVGDSFDLNNIKKFSKPTFLSCFWNNIKIDENKNLFYVPRDNLQNYVHKRNKHIKGALKDYSNSNLTYIMTKKEYFKQFIDKGHNVLSVQEYENLKNNENLEDFFKKNKIDSIILKKNFYKSQPSKKYLSWIPTGSVIPNIYAMLSFVDKINIYGWDFYFSKDPKDLNLFQILSSFKLSPHVSTNFESALINYYYAYKLSKKPNIKIFGRLGKINNNFNLINKIEKVMFK